MNQQLSLLNLPRRTPDFSGPNYARELDRARLTGQIARVFDLMRDGHWRTLSEIENATGDPQASVSAQLRHLRKPEFGGHTMNKQRRGDKRSGLWEYQVKVNEERAAG